MGLGKTLEIISLVLAAKQAGKVGPTLIVCPLSTLSNWSDQIVKYVNVYVNVGGCVSGCVECASRPCASRPCASRQYTSRQCTSRPCASARAPLVTGPTTLHI